MPKIIARRHTPLASLTVLLLSLMVCVANAEPPPGAPSLHMDCRGQKSPTPTVILESGLFGTSADWDLVLDDLAKGGRVCAYDRSGLGLSPPRTGGSDVVAIANELDAMLQAMGETRPVILVGHSNGALYVEGFAALWPKKVAGLVYVNGVNSDDLDYPALVEDLEHERGLANLAVTGGELGLGPMIAEALASGGGLKGDAARRKRETMSKLDQLRVGRDEDVAMIPGLTTVRGLGGALPTLPTVVIVGSPDPHTPLAKAWRAAGLALTQRARTSWMLDADGASHTSPLARDRAYVKAAVDWLRSMPRPGVRPETDRP